MLIDIHNVGHGHCSVVTAPNGAKLMLDCGTRWRDETFWTPSLHYFRQTFEALAPLNLDEDHFADFGNVQRNCTVKAIITNPTIGIDQFRELKGSNRLGQGAEAYLKWLSAPKAAVAPSSLNFGSMQVRWYWPIYGEKCKSTNNLSLAMVCQYGDFRILFAGDLEANGWYALMSLPAFVAELRHINVLVASHHGRRSGCHDGVFEFLKPQAVIISDDEKEHETQETDAWYRTRCTGVPLIGDPQRRRYVLTTRKDNSMHINVGPEIWNMKWAIQNYEWPTKLEKRNTLLTGTGPALPQSSWV